MLKLKLAQIKANTWNCNFLGPQERQNLKQRMNEDGPQKTLPIVVRKTADEYEIVDGEHRWTIAKELGWETINAIEREADDLQSKSLCISYNRWRGRLNWFKLYTIIKKDQDANIDLVVAYQEALSSVELEWVLSLGNLVPTARLVLEQALKKYPEITLEHLHLLSQFPVTQQESLVEKFKTPVVANALTQALTQFLQKNIPFPKENNSKPPPSLLEEINPQTTNFENNSQHIFPKDHSLGRQGFFPEQEPDTPSISPQPLNPNNLNLKTERTDELQRALLVAVSYDCDCGRHYQVNFKNLSVVVRKQNLLFEHADLKPHTFQVRCGRCNSDHEFTIETVDNETAQIFCRRCKPPREGLLDVNSGEAVWFG